MRKSCLTILVIFLLVFALLIGGVVFALRPPYKVVAPRETDATPVKAQAAFTEYIMERAGLALDQYSGEGDLQVSLDQSGLAQVLADVLAAQLEDLPGGLKYTGVFMHVNPDYVQVGGGFKFLILPIGASARLQLSAEDGELKMALLSTHLGRISLPIDFVLKTAGRFIELPLASDALSVSVPVDLGDEMGITLSALGLEAEELLVSLQLEEGVIPEIPAEAVESFQKNIPDMHSILTENPTAATALTEIEELLEQAQSDGKKVNLLRLMALGEELYGVLSEDEFKELEGVLDDDVKKLLEQVKKGNN